MEMYKALDHSRIRTAGYFDRRRRLVFVVANLPTSGWQSSYLKQYRYDFQKKKLEPFYDNSQQYEPIWNPIAPYEKEE